MKVVPTPEPESTNSRVILTSDVNQNASPCVPPIVKAVIGPEASAMKATDRSPTFPARSMALTVRECAPSARFAKDWFVAVPGNTRGVDVSSWTSMRSMPETASVADQFAVASDAATYAPVHPNLDRNDPEARVGRSLDG